MKNIQKNEKKDRNSLLEHTKPSKNNKNILFPDYYPKGRIIVNKGIRMLDWDGKAWKAFEKEGASWFPDDLKDSDYELLNKYLNLGENK